MPYQLDVSVLTRQRLSTLWPAWVVLIQLAACGFGIPLKEPVVVTQQEQRSAHIRPGQSTRESVRAAFGEPWLQSRFWGFDLYLARDTSTELGGLLITIWPVPLGVVTVDVEGYVLIVYDKLGQVAQVASGNASAGFGEQDALMLRAGDLNLGIEKVGHRGLHLMADPTRLQDYLKLRGGSATCTIALACEERTEEIRAYEACPDRVVIDDAPPLDLQPFFGSCEPGGSCPPNTLTDGIYVRVPMVHAITLEPGVHRLVMSSSTFKGRQETSFDCAPGKVRFGVIRGNIDRHWWGPGSSTLRADVSFHDELPSQWISYSMLLYRGHRWIVQPEPDRP